MKTIILTAALATAMLVTGAWAQHDDHHPDGASPPGMMAGMQAHMQEMTMGQNKTADLVKQLADSFAAIEAEKDPDALKEKLAKHGALLKELQANTQSQGRMMMTMQHMMGDHRMGGPAAGDSTK